MSESYGPRRLLLDATHNGLPLAELLNHLMGADAATVLERGGVWLDKMRVQDGSRLVQAGELLTISRPPTGRYEDVQLGPDHIIYEDADLLVVAKPAGAYVDVTPWATTGNIRTALLDLLAARDGTAPPLHLAHRLDRDTSGVLVLSKNPAINPALQRVFAGGLARKQYRALCQGTPTFDTCTVATGHGRGAKGVFRVYPLEAIGQQLPAGGGTIKPMETRLTVLERRSDHALVQAEPITGRTHQIRLHVAYLGHPLLGDIRYGGPAVVPAGHRLHAARLGLPHPRTGQWMEWYVPWAYEQ